MKLLYFNEQNSCDKYSSDHSSNFKHLIAKKGEVISLVRKSENYLFFVRKGELEIVCDDYCRTIKNGEFILIPKSSESVVRVTNNADLVIHSFSSLLNLCDQHTIEKMEAHATKVTYSFEPSKILDPVYSFLELLTFYLSDDMLCKNMRKLKQTEMFILFSTFYTKEECAALFYPILSSNVDFRDLVLDNYQKARTVQELADICCFSLTTFNRKFKLFFNDSPYNWMLKQKARHIRMKLRNPHIPICEIIEEFGFSSSGHFTSYCKTYFDMPPTQLRKKMMEEKEL